MIELTNVTKTYRQGGHKVEALRGVNFRINGPGYFAIMGPSGSGKSTLMHLIGGLDQPDSGKVVINNDDIGSLNERQLTAFRRKGVGIVFQQFNLIPTLTAKQNVELPGVIDRQPRKWIDERSNELLKLMDITDRADHRPDALSGGEQQRVAIARALLFKPKLLLADEPTGNLDSTTSERIWNLLGELAETQQITIVMVTHEPAAAAHCQRVFVLGDGQCRDEFEVNGLDASSLATRYQQHL